MTKPDYRVCCGCATVYLPERGPGAFSVRRCVIPRVYLEGGRRYSTDSAHAGSRLTGTAARESFLLVIPLDERRCTFDGMHMYLPREAYDALEDKVGYFTLGNGVKVYDGVGPEVTTAEAFDEFVPAVVDGLYVVREVGEKRGPKGQLWHVEAGA